MLDATHALTVLAELDGDRTDELCAILTALDVQLVHGSDLPDTHFMRLVIVNDAKRELAPLLAWETNYDGPLDDYLFTIFAAVPHLANAFACCKRFPGLGERDLFLRWMRDRSHRSTAFYTGYRGVPRRQVVNDAALHDALREAADRERPHFGKKTPLQIKDTLVGSVRAAHPELDVSRPPPDDARWALGKVAALALVIVLLPVIAVLFYPWYRTLRGREETDIPDADPRPVYDDKNHHEDEDEDDVVQNQLTHIVDLKPGWFRLFTAWIVLTAIGILASVEFVRGSLGGITDIHFARWLIIYDDRDGIPAAQRRHRMLFFSNYDGSWESYLGEFVDRASSGLTAVWSNCIGFPRTSKLTGAGSRDEEAFKSWARKNQIHTEMWWSGVPTQTVQNVRDNMALRIGCAPGAPTDDDAVTAWLETL